MIKTYTASPVEIKEINMENSGKGTGVNRYASGMYFGSPKTVDYYLDGYKKYNGSDVSYYSGEMEISEGSPGYRAVKELYKNNMSYEETKEVLKDDEQGLIALDVLMDKGDLFIEKGVLYSVELRNINPDDLKVWDSIADDHFILNAGEIFYSNLLSEKDFKDTDWEALGFYVDPEDYEDLVELSFKAALEWLESEGECCNENEDDLKEVWSHYIIGDDCFSNNTSDFFYSSLANSPQMDAIKRITKDLLSLESGTSYGDVYIEISHSLDPLSDPQNDSIRKSLASKFFVEKLKISGFVGESMQGELGSIEYIIIDEDILNSAKFEKMRHADIYESPQQSLPSYKLERDDLNFSPSNRY